MHWEALAEIYKMHSFALAVRFQKKKGKIEKNAILEQCKGVHCVDLDESFHSSKFSFFSFFPCPFFLIFFSKQIAIPTSIYLQNLASIQPRTSALKFAHSRKELERLRKQAERPPPGCSRARAAAARASSPTLGRND